jgi:hypothetical protein
LVAPLVKLLVFAQRISWGLFCNGSFSQEAIANGVTLIRDESGRIVGLTYFGRD